MLVENEAMGVINGSYEWYFDVRAGLEARFNDSNTQPGKKFKR